ncbi:MULTISPECIES: hypothetical protein [Pseudomonas]|uniref:hypothetical protein n=1 Tax=Pseudomonas TaxID=286 RepID=UPI000F491054|nr:MULTISPECIES: hypothetical protein [Pseudomonas]MBS7556928.1 hypothetical protein [Pseudomonas sp. RC4D1]MDP9503637.1 hypothetical protein [Pseudomonas protegens]ROL95542.1 hypothetical protein BK639_06685 [Pseudomonas protegens]ROM01437.1 hypothetical protein BK642_27140 [Pseudomonas protegens]ROM10032.1 hypothetical protein BK640_04870 [Pseudomonas protegens]
MNIFVVSNAIEETAYLLVKQLARITLRESKTTPVIVVDDRDSLTQDALADDFISSSSFILDDFLYDKKSVLAVDANKLATKLSGLSSEWLVFEFGQNEHETCFDFVRKLARYNFMTPTLREKNVVFAVPGLSLTELARALNESFNNLPISHLSVAQSGQVRMLLFSTKIERAFISLPLISVPLMRLRRLVMFIYRRFLKAA